MNVNTLKAPGPQNIVAPIGTGTDMARRGAYGDTVWSPSLVGVWAGFFLDSVSDKAVVLLVSRAFLEASLKDIVDIVSFCLGAKKLCSNFKAPPCFLQLGLASSHFLIPIFISPDLFLFLNMFLYFTHL